MNLKLKSLFSTILLIPAISLKITPPTVYAVNTPQEQQQKQTPPQQQRPQPIVKLQPNDFIYTPIDSMLFSAIIERNLTTINSLVSARANLGSLDASLRYHGLSLSIWCGFDTATMAILNSGADHRSYINRRYINGDTMLHAAIQHGNLEIINALLENGADPNTNNTSYRTPFAQAVRENKFDIAQTLLDHGATDNPNTLKLAIITKDSFLCNGNKVLELWRKGAKLGLLNDVNLANVLCKATDNMDIELIDHMLALKPSIVNTLDANNGSALCAAFFSNEWEIADKLVSCLISCVQNVNAKIFENVMCIAGASSDSCPRFDLIEKMCEKNIDIDVGKCDYNTILSHMVKRAADNICDLSYLDDDDIDNIFTNMEKVAVLLFKKGADPANVPNALKQLDENDMAVEYKKNIAAALTEAHREAKERA